MRPGKRVGMAWVVGASMAIVAACLALLVWAGDRLATVLIDTLIKVMLWGFGFGWLKAAGL